MTRAQIKCNKNSIQIQCVPSSFVPMSLCPNAPFLHHHLSKLSKSPPPPSKPMRAMQQKCLSSYCRILLIFVLVTIVNRMSVNEMVEMIASQDENNHNDDNSQTATGLFSWGQLGKQKCPHIPQIYSPFQRWEKIQMHKSQWWQQRNGLWPLGCWVQDTNAEISSYSSHFHTIALMIKDTYTFITMMTTAKRPLAFGMPPWGHQCRNVLIFLIFTYHCSGDKNHKWGQQRNRLWPLAFGLEGCNA